MKKNPEQCEICRLYYLQRNYTGFSFHLQIIYMVLYFIKLDIFSEPQCLVEYTVPVYSHLLLHISRLVSYLEI